MKSVLVCRFLLLSLVVPRSFAQSGTSSDPEPEANPGRPTVSTPATLTPAGYLQFENGALFADSSMEFSRRFGVGQITKLTVLPRLELFLQSEPLAVSESQERTAVQVGEVFAGLQGVVYQGHGSRPTVSLSYTRRLYASPAPELDLGTFRQSGTILLSDDLYGFHLDGNGIFTEQIEGTVHRAQFAQTLSVSHPLGRFTLSGEIWHFSQPFLGGNAVGNLWALSRAARKNLVVDGGFDHGLTQTSTHWEAFLGFTYLLPHRLWPDHRDARSNGRDPAE